METSTARAIHDPAADFYIGALKQLQDTNIPFLVGGAFAFSHYSHVPRDTKDIDVFVKPDDCPRVLEAFDRLGYRTEVPFPHWLGKIHSGEHFMDVIFASGNGIARVDDLWFEHAPKTQPARHHRPVVARRRDHLVEGVHSGARAIRRG
jgi:hypothetical protein